MRKHKAGNEKLDALLVGEIRFLNSGRIRSDEGLVLEKPASLSLTVNSLPYQQTW